MAPAAELAAEADARSMDDRFHRRVVVEQGARRPRGRASPTLGYTLSTHLVLAHHREPDRRVDTSCGARGRARRPGRPRGRRRTLAEPWGDEEIARPARRGEAADRRGRVPTALFRRIRRTARSQAGARCAARAASRRSRTSRCSREFRGRGLGRAIVQHALDEAPRGARARVPRGARRRLAARAVREARLRRRRPARLLHAAPAPADAPPAAHAAARAAARRRSPSCARSSASPRRASTTRRRCRSGSPWTDDLDEEASSSRTTTSRRAGPRTGRQPRRLPDGEPVGVQAVRGRRSPRATVDTGSWLGRRLPGRRARHGDARRGASRSRSTSWARRSRHLRRDRSGTRSRSASRASSATS